MFLKLEAVCDTMSWWNLYTGSTLDFCFENLVWAILPGLPFLDILCRNVRLKIDSWLIGKHSVVIPSKTAASLSIEFRGAWSAHVAWFMLGVSSIQPRHCRICISRWSCRVGGGLWHLLEVLDDRHSRRTRKENDQSDMDQIFMTFWAHFTMLFENIWTHPSSIMLKYVQICSDAFKLI